MTVLTYLNSKASDAVLSGFEKTSIDTSIATLQFRLNSYFNNTEATNHFRFGSSTRGTILPRSMDEQSDIDYMIVFSNSSTLYTPQTYIEKLKRFASSKYGTSEIYQSYPTIVLELNHIKFDLVPAIKHLYSDLQIPDGAGWIATNPNDINSILEDKNRSHYSLIKPTIRLFKYWNSKAGYPCDSFKSEKWMTGLSYFYCYNQRDFIFHVFDNLTTSSNYANWVNSEIIRAKNIISKTKAFELANLPASAEIELKKLFRD